MSCFNFIIMKVNGTDVSNLAYEEAIQLFLSAHEPIIVEVRRRGSEDSNKLNCFNYDTHISPTLAVIASSNKPSLYGTKDFSKSNTDEISTLKSAKKITDKKTGISSISCQTELSAFDNESKEILFMRGDSDLNSGTFFRRKDYQTPINVDTLNGILRTEYDVEEITLRKTQSAENLGFTISYGIDEFSDSDTCSDECLEECRYPPETNEAGEENNDIPSREYKVYVSDVVPNSLADRDGRLRQGDRILQINGQNILPKTDPNKLLAEYKHSVTLLVSREFYAGDDEFLDSAVYCDDKECQDYQHQSSICECEQTTYSSKSSICQSEQKNCTSTTMTNIYPVLPIAVENVSDLFNHANIKAQLESVNKEISLLNSQISIMKLHQLQSDPQANTSTKGEDIQSQATADCITKEKSSISHASRPDEDTEHIYETIPEDNEAEAYYCSPYEGVNGIRVEQWLNSIGSSKRNTKRIIYPGEKSKINLNKQPTLQKLQKYNPCLDDYDNSSSAYNTGGSSSSALFVLEQSNQLNDTLPIDQMKASFKCKNVRHSQSKTQYVNKGDTGNLKSTPSQDITEKHRRAPLPSMIDPPVIPHISDIDSDGHSTLIARPGSYKMCQYKFVADSKDEKLSQVVWKVKRRPDGTRYIVRRVTKSFSQNDKSHQEASTPSSEYRKQVHKFKERRQRNRNQVTPSNEKHHAQHWLV